jgi:hypothetical protein
MLFRDAVDKLIWDAQHGDNYSVRASAISKLSIEFLKSDDRVVGGIIAAFVRDESISSDLRLFAYLCLLDLSTRRCDEYPDMKTFRFPDDVDWDFVNRYLSKKSG